MPCVYPIAQESKQDLQGKTTRPSVYPQAVCAYPWQMRLLHVTSTQSFFLVSYRLAARPRVVRKISPPLVVSQMPVLDLVSPLAATLLIDAESVADT